MFSFNLQEKCNVNIENADICQFAKSNRYQATNLGIEQNAVVEQMTNAQKEMDNQDAKTEIPLKLVQDNISKTKSESVLYGGYIISQLEKFDEHTRAVVKYKIAKILFEAEIGKLQRPH